MSPSSLSIHLTTADKKNPEMEPQFTNLENGEKAAMYGRFWKLNAAAIADAMQTRTVYILHQWSMTVWWGSLHVWSGGLHWSRVDYGDEWKRSHYVTRRSRRYRKKKTTQANHVYLWWKVPSRAGHLCWKVVSDFVTFYLYSAYYNTDPVRYITINWWSILYFKRKN